MWQPKQGKGMHEEKTMIYEIKKHVDGHTIDGCLKMETLWTLLPWPCDRRSLEYGMLFQLSPRAGFEVPPSPPTVWLITYKIKNYSLSYTSTGRKNSRAMLTSIARLCWCASFLSKYPADVIKARPVSIKFEFMTPHIQSYEQRKPFVLIYDLNILEEICKEVNNLSEERMIHGYIPCKLVPPSTGAMREEIESTISNRIGQPPPLSWTLFTNQ